ncbi:hypothetical protein OGAPHI_001929 [Ogataea philodendri]|uniref:Uncharacterized protein n=1 Tax=Ogataea philodendri TaxID=1378263 RepID=A0A9P8PAG6_9ASCO|nr:uncharacterized protein OGAPHI_001929 [Ogataea philodendri]KAH3668175.1 hypothetical protein OGAPHI_001929 [Ogataea philodendri]
MAEQSKRFQCQLQHRGFLEWLFRLLSVSKVETELRSVKQPIVDGVVNRWNNLIDGNSVVGQSQDTVKLTKSESKTWLAGCLGEVLFWNDKVSDSQSVLGNVTLKRSGTVVDTK